VHISEGFLPLAHCIGWGAASLPFAVVSVRSISKELDRKRDNRVLLAASAAFLFTLSSLRMPSITGSSSHPTGTAVGTYLFGAAAMPALALITLGFQALLLAHGGLTTLGANLFSLGVVGPWVTWLVFALWRRLGFGRDRGIFLGTVLGDLATYLTTAVQLALAYPSPHGGFTASFLKFAGVFLITQIPISIAEGLLTVVVMRSLATEEKSLLAATGTAEMAQEASRGYRVPIIVTMVFAALVGAAFVVNRNFNAEGTDDKALSAVHALQPGYRPIAKPIWVPNATAEGLLFALQGAIGVAILGWALYRYRASRARKAGLNRAHPHIHVHPHLSDIAFVNAWRHRNPWEKVLFGGGLLVVALLVPPWPWCIVVAVVVTIAATAGARIPASSWAGVLAIPVSFSLLTALGFLLQIDRSGSTFTMAIDWGGIPVAFHLLLRSVAAISCLAFIGWTTPLMELIPIVERVGVPPVLIDLALMIYRFLFVTATTLGEMRQAQSWRMGRADARSRLRAVSMLAGG
jgi:cobalt/nickel transport system permease protein